MGLQLEQMEWKWTEKQEPGFSSSSSIYLVDGIGF